MCIKKICESVNSIIRFSYTSPLPWVLTEKVIKNFSYYKWNYLLENSRQSDWKINTFLFELIDYEDEIDPIDRSGLLSLNSLEPNCCYAEYCIWGSYYEIPKYNLILCKTCFKIFCEVFTNFLHREVPTHYFDSFHQYFHANGIHRAYQNRKNWCFNSFNELVFQLKCKDECIHNLHSSYKKMKFSDI